MKNGDFLLGAAIGAVIAGCALSAAFNPPRRKDEEKDECGERFPQFCPCAFPCCPCEKKQKKKDPCKGCYYEKYERKCR